ncbi:MAG: flagellar protein FliS [Lachnospiraceae bacterium]|nr:flagellar protein FliS [Lachnospiraceae bacterium]
MTSEKKQEYTLKITNASPTGIIVILYDLAIEYINDGIACFDAEDHEGAKQACTNAGRVLGDLISSLDFSYGISFQLFRIYEFISKEVSMAVIRNDRKPLTDSIRLLSSLRESFEKLSEQDTSGPAMSNTQTVYAGLTYGKGTLNESTSYTGDNRGYSV